MSNSKILTLAMLALTVMACDDPMGPDSVIQPAQFDGLNHDDALLVDVWENALRVEIRTLGNTCTAYNHDHVQVDEVARVITIRPYNRQYYGVCHDIGLTILHKVTVDPG